MMRLPVLASLVLALALPAAAQQQSSPFSDAEKAALHAEIRAYLLDHPELLLEVLQKLEAQQQAQSAATDRELVAANAAALFDDGFSFVAGNPEGSLTIVEFLDYQCGYCRKAFPEVSELVAADGDIRLVIKEFPILGPGSDLAARAAIATLITEGPEAYLTLHDRLMALQGEVTDVRLDKLLGELGHDPAAVRAAMADPEVARRLAETRALGERLAISGTPTFVFDDRVLRGYLPLEQMQALVADVRTAE
jgi:protein-disulfide isomerase